MSIYQNIKNYWAGMAVYDRCHPPTVAGQWQAFIDEWGEFRAEPSLAEAWDVLHTVGRLGWKLTGIPLQIIALPTVLKHGRRYSDRGCIRSQRNCEGKCCQSTFSENKTIKI